MRLVACVQAARFCHRMQTLRNSLIVSRIELNAQRYECLTRDYCEIYCGDLLLPKMQLSASTNPFIYNLNFFNCFVNLEEKARDAHFLEYTKNCIFLLGKVARFQSTIYYVSLLLVNKVLMANGFVSRKFILK